MSCEECEKAQEDSRLVAYYRWKNANVAMIGCDKHLREIFDALKAAQK
jgi:hypothetical protein